MNVDWLSRLPRSVRRGLYFGLQEAIGSRVRAAFGEFLEWERFSAAELDSAVSRKLERLLKFATRNCEYYRTLGVAGGEGEAKEWLGRFPVLSRPAVRENFSRLVCDDLRSELKSPDDVSPRRYDWLVVKTGGTTGAPTAVVHDAAGRDSGRATRLYAARQCGFPLGVPYFRLWGSEQDLLNKEVSLSQRILRALLQERPLNAFKAREAALQDHLREMRAHPEIRHLMTYVDAAAGLASYVERQRLQAPTFDTIMACAGTVTPDFRELLQRTFSAQVFDKYGSRDCCDVACECAHHTGLHVFSPHAYVEIVDDQGRACAPGQTGRVLVTLLNNLSFPLIRYEVGDLGRWAEPGPCPCGSPFPRIESLQGRPDDMLLTEDGTLQSSVFVRHFVGVSLNRGLIQEWQLEQTGRTEFIFRYIPLAREGLDANLEKLRESFLLVFGKSCSVQTSEVAEIPPSATGKVRWIVNSYRKAG